jgi:hypothetical protein
MSGSSGAAGWAAELAGPDGLAVSAGGPLAAGGAGRSQATVANASQARHGTVIQLDSLVMLIMHSFRSSGRRT